MLTKEPKYGKGYSFLRVFLFAEFAFFGATWLGYRQLNTNRDFRKLVKNKYPWILEQYYTFGETWDPALIKIRQADKEIWEAEETFKAKRLQQQHSTT